MNQYKAWDLLPEEKVCLKSEVDEAIAELKDKCQMHDFFWEGCGFAKRGFKNAIAVSEAYDRLEEENKELKDKLHNVSELLKETREWLIESQKLHKRCADNAIKEIRHHKYKRCLAMARWCESEAYIHEYGSEYDEDLVAWFGELYKRWLEIAEVFK